MRSKFIVKFRGERESWLPAGSLVSRALGQPFRDPEQRCRAIVFLRRFGRPWKRLSRFECRRILASHLALEAVAYAAA